MYFSGIKDSFAEVHVPYYTPLDNNNDYVILFYVYFDDVTSGTILDFKSTANASGSMEIRKYRLYVINSTLEMSIKNYGTHNFNVTLQSQIWYHIAIQRDRSKGYFSIFVDGGSEQKGFNISLSDKVTLLPGKFRLGGDFDETDPLQGAMACLQWIPCKNSVERSYDSQCQENNWYFTSTTPSTSDISLSDSRKKSTSTADSKEEYSSSIEMSSVGSKGKSSDGSKEHSSAGSKETSSAGSNETSSAGSKETSSAGSNETSSAGSKETSSAGSKETSSAVSKEKSSPVSKEQSSGSKEKSSVRSKGTLSDDSKETALAGSMEQLSARSIELSSGSKEKSSAGSKAKSSDGTKENSDTSSEEQPSADSEGKSTSEEKSYFHSAKKRSSDSDEMSSSSTSTEVSTQTTSTYSTVTDSSSHSYTSAADLVNAYLLLSAKLCITNEPIFIWPLGEDIGVTNIKTNQSDGRIRQVSYITSPDTIGGYNTMYFSGNKDSFAEVRIPYYTPLENNNDYVIHFYVYFDDVTSGTILDFKSIANASDSMEIRKYRLYVINSTLEMSIKNYGTHNFNVTLQPQVWYHIAIQRDRSNGYFSIFVNGSSEQKGFNISLSDKVTLLPGKFRLGGDFDETDPLQGAMACLQWVPCKDSVDRSYDSQCEETNWHATTMAYPASTTVSYTQLLTTASTLSSFTNILSTSTTVTQLTTLSTHQSTVSPTIATSGHQRNKNSHFKRVAVNATFGSPSDIIAVVNVHSVIHCTQICLRNIQCLTFVVENSLSPFVCKLGGKLSALIDSDTEALVYQALQ
ncbi:hypothetical protein ACF0H5_009976 [Mactra antiquata]